MYKNKNGGFSLLELIVVIAIMAVLGVLCLGTGYFIAITTKNPIKALTLFFVAVILVIIGTYFIFMAGSIAVLKFLRKRKRILLSDQAFYIRIGNDLPDETKRSGTCKHLHLIHHGIGSRIDNSQSLCRY